MRFRITPNVVGCQQTLAETDNPSEALAAIQQITRKNSLRLYVNGRPAAVIERHSGQLVFRGDVTSLHH